MTRVQTLCRRLKPILGHKIDRLYRTYLAEDHDGRADLEQTLELLAVRHLGQDFQPDRSPFPPPSRSFAQQGQIPLGQVSYGQKPLYPFHLRADRLKEHLVVCGRSGSGKTNLTFELMRGLMEQGIHVLALDWKRGYRDLKQLHPDLQVYTIGREVARFAFNPLIPPPGCEVTVWTKLIVDVIASAYLGGEGVISLLVSGLDQLYRDLSKEQRWPTFPDVLAWLKTRKLKGRAAMWQASAERILLAMTYGEFADVVNTQNNRMADQLLQHQIVLEMDGLSSQNDRIMFSESLTLWLYRKRLAQGPQPHLTNIIILEEAHNLLLAKAAGSRESVLESSIRQIRQYGLGYIFVDQSASLLSKVAFANSYATLALSQKLAADVRTMAGAMNLDDDQKAALSTLPIGTAIVRLADEHPEPFLVQVPLSPVQEGTVDDAQLRQQTGLGPTGSTELLPDRPPVPPIPPPDSNSHPETNPPSPSKPLSHQLATTPNPPSEPSVTPPTLTREETRFLHDIIQHPLTTTIHRYHRLHFSRRRGNAIRRSLVDQHLITAYAIATRSGQVMLYALTDLGISVSQHLGLNPPPSQVTSLEHRYWAQQIERHYTHQGYDVAHEVAISQGRAIDLVATRPGHTIAIEVETGKSNIHDNLTKLQDTDHDQIILLATNPSAVQACQKAIDTMTDQHQKRIACMTWLDLR